MDSASQQRVEIMLRELFKKATGKKKAETKQADTSAKAAPSTPAKRAAAASSKSAATTTKTSAPSTKPKAKAAAKKPAAKKTVTTEQAKPKAAAKKPAAKKAAAKKAATTSAPTKKAAAKPAAKTKASTAKSTSVEKVKKGTKKVSGSAAKAAASAAKAGKKVFQTATKAPLPTAKAAKPRPQMHAQVPRPVKKTSTPQSMATIHGFEPYSPAADEEYMNEKQRAHFRAILLAWRQQLMEEADRTMHHLQDEQVNMPDPADRATQEEEFALELRTRDRERKLLKKIEKVLDKVDTDDFGYCDACGVEIGIRRLEARPTADLCIDCKELAEIKEKQLAG